MSEKSETPTDDDHTLPPDQPIPSAELSQYTLSRDEHDEAEIADYVNGQCRGEEFVQHLELVKTEFVLGRQYDVWDVHTDKQRWWVLTNLTNLYPQEHFPSLDYTLSFHIGLMQRLMARQERESEFEPDPFEEVYRRLSEAADQIVRAVQAEEFQSIGMRLREGLIALIDIVKRVLNPKAEGELPKSADVVGGSNAIINHACPGKSNKALRQYLKSTVEKTWQLVNWLTHDRDANKVSAIMASEAVGLLVGHYVQLTMRDRIDLVDECPNCASRDVKQYFDPLIGVDGDYYQRCRSCGWSTHPNSE